MCKEKNKSFLKRKANHGGTWLKGKFKINSKEKPLISIITVTLNSQKYLNETLKSISGGFSFFVRCDWCRQRPLSILLLCWNEKMSKESKQKNMLKKRGISANSCSGEKNQPSLCHLCRSCARAITSLRVVPLRRWILRRSSSAQSRLGRPRTVDGRFAEDGSKPAKLREKN